jgi:hypothetical protein
MSAKWMRLVEVPHHRPIPQDELNDASLLVRELLNADVIFTQFKGEAFVRLSAHGNNTTDQYERLVSITRSSAAIEPFCGLGCTKTAYWNPGYARTTRPLRWRRWQRTYRPDT